MLLKALNLYINCSYLVKPLALCNFLVVFVLLLFLWLDFIVDLSRRRQNNRWFSIHLCIHVYFNNHSGTHVNDYNIIKTIFDIAATHFVAA